MIKHLLFVFLLLPGFALAEDFVAGKDYAVIQGATPGAAGKQTVNEFFSYGCPWCYRVEPSVNTWIEKHKNNITFSKVPVVFHKEWIYYAKAYYAAELLGLSNKLSPVLFKTIQTDKKPLDTDQSMIDFFVSQGVDRDTAISAFTHSTTIDMKIAEASAAMGRFHINAVPAFVINQHYKTDLQMAGSEERLFKILDYLAGKKD